VHLEEAIVSGSSCNLVWPMENVGARFVISARSMRRKRPCGVSCSGWHCGMNICNSAMMHDRQAMVFIASSLHRFIASSLHRLARHPCMVVAPSLMPRKRGDHVKTNQRDAVALATRTLGHDDVRSRGTTPQTSASPPRMSVRTSSPARSSRPSPAAQPFLRKDCNIKTRDQTPSVGTGLPPA
jgi:hypothetical protein